MKQPRKRQYYKDEEFLKKIGARIREFRILKKMSMETLANEHEINYTQISRMELGKVNFSVSTLSRIAKILGVEPEDLVK